MGEQRKVQARLAAARLVGRNTAAGQPDSASASSSCITPNSTRHCVDAGAVGIDYMSSSDDGCDSQGRCVRHPFNRMRKKKMLGGREVLMTACPFCCMEELFGVHMDGVGGVWKGDVPKSVPVSSAMAQSHSYDWDDAPRRRRSTNSVDTATTCSTGGSRSSFNSFKGFNSPRTGGNPQQAADRTPWQSLDRAAAEADHDANALFHVERMEYIDDRGSTGRYSGTVDRRRIPHGHGVMAYGNGVRVRGEWKNGRLGGSRRREVGSPSRPRRFEGGETPHEAAPVGVGINI